MRDRKHHCKNFHNFCSLYTAWLQRKINPKFYPPARTNNLQGWNYLSSQKSPGKDQGCCWDTTSSVSLPVSRSALSSLHTNYPLLYWIPAPIHGPWNEMFCCSTTNWLIQKDETKTSHTSTKLNVSEEHSKSGFLLHQTVSARLR